LTMFGPDDCITCTYAENYIFLNRSQMDSPDWNDFLKTKTTTHEVGHALGLRHPTDAGLTDRDATPSVMWQGETPWNTPQLYDTDRVRGIYP
jgi:hypothetical protein